MKARLTFNRQKSFFKKNYVEVALVISMALVYIFNGIYRWCLLGDLGRNLFVGICDGVYHVHGWRTPIHLTLTPVIFFNFFNDINYSYYLYLLFAFVLNLFPVILVCKCYRDRKFDLIVYFIFTYVVLLFGQLKVSSELIVASNYFVAATVLISTIKSVSRKNLILLSFSFLFIAPMHPVSLFFVLFLQSLFFALHGLRIAILVTGVGSIALSLFSIWISSEFSGIYEELIKNSRLVFNDNAFKAIIEAQVAPFVFLLLLLFVLSFLVRMNSKKFFKVTYLYFCIAIVTISIFFEQYDIGWEYISKVFFGESSYYLVILFSCMVVLFRKEAPMVFDTKQYVLMLLGYFICMGLALFYTVPHYNLLTKRYHEAIAVSQRSLSLKRITFLNRFSDDSDFLLFSKWIADHSSKLKLIEKDGSRLRFYNYPRIKACY